MTSARSRAEHCYYLQSSSEPVWPRLGALHPHACRDNQLNVSKRSSYLHGAGESYQINFPSRLYFGESRCRTARSLFVHRDNEKSIGSANFHCLKSRRQLRGNIELLLKLYINLVLHNPEDDNTMVFTLFSFNNFASSFSNNLKYQICACSTIFQILFCNSRKAPHFLKHNGVSVNSTKLGYFRFT